ncbi:hypothetical protein XH87_00235 [Bradyrhizobium sp. CCBAU 53415]|nr:hypothetical protein [Bradyrhizobium sp. CCBAU 53415]
MTIAAFRRDNGLALRGARLAMDGSKFKAVNNRDKNFTRAKGEERRRAQLEEILCDNCFAFKSI